MFRKLAPIALAAALALAPSSAQALELANPIREAGHWGIGIGGGLGPSGFSAKYYFSRGFALQGVVGGYGYGRNWNGGWRNDNFGAAGLGVLVDFLFEMPAIVEGDVLELGWNIGPGAWIGVGSDFWFGVSGTLGLEFNFKPVPIDIVLEYKPALRLVSSRSDNPVGFNPWNFGAHVRIYFM